MRTSRSLRLRPALASAATAALLVGGLAACGSETTATDEPDASSQEQEQPAAADVDLPDEGETVDNSEFAAWMLAGLEDSTTAHMTMTTDYGMGGVEAEGQVDYTTSPVSMTMSMTGVMGDNPIDMRVVDGVMYMDMGSMSNDKFIKFDLSDPSSLPPGMEDLGDQMDPLAAFRQFEPALEDVVYVGNEDVEGDSLDHFAATMNTAEIPQMAELPADAGVPETVAYDLWFDEVFRIRQMQMVMELGGDMALKVDVDAQLFDWGSPVDIQAPSPDQISDAPLTGTVGG